MTSFTSLVTSACFLAHAILGCCSHHAHATGHTPAGQVSDAGQNVAAQTACEDGHHPEQSCAGLECTFATGDKVPLAKVTLSPVSPICNLLVASPQAKPTLADVGLEFIRLPLRTHLYYQVLLI